MAEDRKIIWSHRRPHRAQEQSFEKVQKTRLPIGLEADRVAFFPVTPLCGHFVARILMTRECIHTPTLPLSGGNRIPCVKRIKTLAHGKREIVETQRHQMPDDEQRDSHSAQILANPHARLPCYSTVLSREGPYRNERLIAMPVGDRECLCRHPCDFSDLSEAQGQKTKHAVRMAEPGAGIGVVAPQRRSPREAELGQVAQLSRRARN